MALQDFITHVKTVGMLVGNKFEFVAPALEGTLPTSSNTVSLLCSTTNLPGLTLMTNDLRYYGEITERPSQIIYPSINLTFYLDNDLSAKRYFEQWIGMVFNRETRAMNYYDLYTRDVEIVVYNKAEQEIERVKLFECYPKSVNDVNLDYHNNSVSVISVNLIYKWWSSSQSENWKGNSGSSIEETSQMPTFGFDGLGLGTESMGNLTGETIFGKGTPDFMKGITDNGFDLQGALEGLGTDLKSTGIRGFQRATDLLGFSDIGNSIMDQFKNNFSNLSESFGNLGSGVGLLGSSLDNILPAMSNISSPLSSIGIGSINLGNIMGQIGAGTDLSSPVGNILRMSDVISTVSDVSQLPQYLNSVSSNFNEIGSSVSQVIQDSSNSSATKNSLVSVANTYFSTGSLLSRVASLIGK